MLYDGTAVGDGVGEGLGDGTMVTVTVAVFGNPAGRCRPCNDVAPKVGRVIA